MLAASAPPFRVSHVLLDVDGTLVDYETAARPAFEAAAAHVRALTGSDVIALDVYFARQAVTEDPEWRDQPVQRVRHESIRRLLAGCGSGAATDGAIREVLAAYEDARDRHLTIYPDVHAGLAALRATGVTLIAASNGNVDLDRVGLAQHITATHYAAAVGVSKPDPRFFALALARFGIAPERALVVGDRFDNDYAPARASGLHAVLLDRAGAQVGNAEVVRVSALTEVAALIAPLADRPRVL